MFVTRYGFADEKGAKRQGEDSVLLAFTPAGKPEIFTLERDIFFFGYWAMVRLLETEEITLSHLRFYRKEKDAVEAFELSRATRPGNEMLFLLDLKREVFVAEPELPEFENFFPVFPALGWWGKDNGVPSRWKGNVRNYFPSIERGECIPTPHPISCAILLHPETSKILAFHLLAEEVEQGAVWSLGKELARS